MNSPILNPKIEIPTKGLLKTNKKPMNNSGDKPIMSLIFFIEQNYIVLFINIVVGVKICYLKNKYEK